MQSLTTSGNSLATSLIASSQRTMPLRMAFDLVTYVNNFRGRDWATWKA